MCPPFNLVTPIVNKRTDNGSIRVAINGHMRDSSEWHNWLEWKQHCTLPAYQMSTRFKPNNKFATIILVLSAQSEPKAKAWLEQNESISGNECMGLNRGGLFAQVN